MTACPCCASRVPEADDWFECSVCAHQWRHTKLELNSVYYQQLQFRNDTSSETFNKKLQERAEAVAAQICRQNAIRILEIGCAEGELGKRLKQHFPLTYDGIELSRDAERAIESLDRIFRIPATDLTSQPYDLIVSFHVLEHIDDVAQELQAWYRLLNENGRLLLEVPHRAGHPWLRNDMNPEHLHQFSAQSLLSLLSTAGFEIVSMSTGHFESSVYNDGLRILAKPALTLEQKERCLLESFHKHIRGDFFVYGIGGDFKNYVYPYMEFLSVKGLLDTSETQWGKVFSGLSVMAYDPALHANSPMLVASVRFKDHIVEHLLSLGIARDLIVTLDDIYGATF